MSEIVWFFGEIVGGYIINGNVQQEIEKVGRCQIIVRWLEIIWQLKDIY